MNSGPPRSNPTRLEGPTYQYYRGFKERLLRAFEARTRRSRVCCSRIWGKRVFAAVSREVGLLDSSWSGDASPVDFNGDGWQDLYVLNMQGHDEYYENVAGRHLLKRGREIFPKTPWGSMGIKSLDYDNDSRMDLFISDMHSDMSLPVEPADEKLKAYMQFPEDFLQSEGLSIFGNAFYRPRRRGAIRRNLRPDRH